MTQQGVYDLIASISDESKISLTALEKQMISELVKTINASAITTGGTITGLTQSAGSIVTKSLKSFYSSAAYKKSIASILKNLDVAVDQKLSVYKDEGLEISKKALSNGQKIVIDEFIDNLSDNGLNSKFNQPLRQLIYDNIRNNVDLNGLRDSLIEKIESGKAPSELSKYVKNATRQAADAYTSIVDTEIFNKFKNRVTHFMIVGTLIETSSPQCRQFVEKYDRKIPIEELDKWISFAKENGGSEELTADNLPTLKAHYGCRHQFIPYIETNN